VTPDPLTGRTVVTNLRLPGQYDERLLWSLGLQGPYYNWNRWYLPGMGRYLKLDPIALGGGFNGEWGPDWYNYGPGNPLSNIDPTGEFDNGSCPGCEDTCCCAAVKFGPDACPGAPPPKPSPKPGPKPAPPEKPILPPPLPPDDCDDECEDNYRACIAVAGTPGVGKYISAGDRVQCERDCRFGNGVPKGTWPSRTQCDYKHAGYN
jgi:RHS repeat-associated protein